MLLPAVVLAAAFPRLAALRDDVPERNRLERRLGAALLGLGVLVGGVFFFARAPLVELVFGATFARAVTSLRTLAVGVPLVYVNFGLTHFLVARDRERVNTWLAFMMLVVTVVLDVALIPRGGGPGAAAATVIAEVALTLGCLFMLRAPRLLDRSPSSSRATSRRGRMPA
jgi:O-antigen/teichoic acid export membrane protein